MVDICLDPRMKQEDLLSPTLQRKVSNNTKGYKNFNLAAKVFLILGRWIETHFEVCIVYFIMLWHIVLIDALYDRISRMIQK